MPRLCRPQRSSYDSLSRAATMNYVRFLWPKKKKKPHPRCRPRHFARNIGQVTVVARDSRGSLRDQVDINVPLCFDAMRFYVLLVLLLRAAGITSTPLAYTGSTTVVVN